MGDRAQLKTSQMGQWRTPTGIVASSMTNWNQTTHLPLTTMHYQHMSHHCAQEHSGNRIGRGTAHQDSPK